MWSIGVVHFSLSLSALKLLALGIYYDTIHAGKGL